MPSPTSTSSAEDSKTVTVQVNEQSIEVPADSSILNLLQSLKLRGGPVAVELNHELVPSNRHADVQLKEGDSLEVVSLTGGG